MQKGISKGAKYRTINLYRFCHCDRRWSKCTRTSWESSWLVAADLKARDCWQRWTSSWNTCSSTTWRTAQLCGAVWWGSTPKTGTVWASPAIMLPSWLRASMLWGSTQAKSTCFWSRCCQAPQKLQRRYSSMTGWLWYPVAVSHQLHVVALCGTAQYKVHIPIWRAGRSSMVLPVMIQLWPTPQANYR